MPRTKHVALEAGFRLGLLRLMQLAERRRPVILMFHRFSGNGRGHPDGLPIRLFARYMEYLSRRYRVVPLGELVHELRGGRIRPNTAAVTVDDGYEDFFSLAVPVLRSYGIRGSVFVITDFVDGRLWPWTDRLRFVFEHAPCSPITFSYRDMTRVLDLQHDDSRRQLEEHWRAHAKTVTAAEGDELVEQLADACGIDIPTRPPREYRPMTWEQLRALAAEGFDVGAHTRTHPILSHVGGRRLCDEIGGCKEQLEQELGRPIAHFAYPNGCREDYTAETIEAVAHAGYTAAVTTIPGTNTAATPIFELRRVAADDPDLAHFAQSVSGFERWRTAARTRLATFVPSPRPRISTNGHRRQTAGESPC